ncbi:hypothetical protein V6O07_00490 [Arthrospira platensis SPKY2]
MKNNIKPTTSEREHKYKDGTFRLRIYLGGIAIIYEEEDGGKFIGTSKTMEEVNNTIEDWLIF